MKRAGQIFSAICIIFIVSIHLIQLTKPFEWQRQQEPSIDELTEFHAEFFNRNPFPNEFEFSNVDWGGASRKFDEQFSETETESTDN